MPTEKAGQEEESTWLRVLGKLGAISAVVTAVVAGMFALFGTTITTWQTLELERRKYEYSLISEILSVEEFDQEISSDRLHFLVEIGVIKSLNRKALEAIAKDGSPPSLPAASQVPNSPSTAASGPPSYADLWEYEELVGQCRRVSDNESIELHRSSGLYATPENRIGTIDAGTEIILTGVRRPIDGGPSAVQILVPDDSFVQNVGWVAMSELRECEE